MSLTGAAKSEISVLDVSIIIEAALKGITCFLGITKKGEAGKPVFVRSWLDFQRKLGGEYAGTDFPLICKRALDGGAPLWVSRAAHYTDVADPLTIDGTKATATVGVAATDQTVWDAREVGDGYNGIAITVTAAASGDATKVDITIIDNDVPTEPEIYANQPLVPTAKELAILNAQFNHVQVTLTDGQFAIATATLATGTFTVASVAATDYVGDQAGATGLYSFDSVTDASKIAVPEIADGAVDTGINTYVNLRGDLIGIIRTPLGLDKDGVIAYRQGDAPYTHAEIDNAYMAMFTGGLEVLSDFDTSVKEISEIGGVVARAAKTDQLRGEWFAFGGPQRGKIQNAIGVVTNFGSPAKSTDLNAIDSRRVNAVIEHPVYGPVIWGNNTLQKSSTLLKDLNVAELVIFMKKVLKPIYDFYLLDPNDPVTWRALFRKVKPVLEGLKEKRAFSDYIYQGDQNAEVKEDAVFNKLDDLDAGKYKVRVFFKPISALKYIGVELVLTNSSVDFGVITEEQI